MAVKHEQIEVAHVSCSWSADFEFLGEVIIYQQFGGGMKYVLGEEGYSGIYPKPCLLLIGGGVENLHIYIVHCVDGMRCRDREGGLIITTSSICILTSFYHLHVFNHYLHPLPNNKE